MAYQNGTATDPTDLLNKIRSFAVANGFTQEDWKVEGSYQVLNLSKGGKYYNFRADNAGAEIRMSLSTAFSGGASWGTQTNDSVLKAESIYEAGWAAVEDIAGPYPSYHFFAQAECIHVAFERSSGVYKHLSFGELIKAGAYTGGEYVAGHRWGTHPNEIDDILGLSHNVLFWSRHDNSSVTSHTLVRADAPVGETSPHYAQMGGRLDGAHRNGYGTQFEHMNQLPLAHSPNTHNGRAILLPVTVYMRDGTSSYYPLGQVSGMRAVNIENLSPGDPVLTDWMVFPITKKNLSSGGDDYNSLTYGVAYYKNP